MTPAELARRLTPTADEPVCAVCGQRAPAVHLTLVVEPAAGGERWLCSLTCAFLAGVAHGRAT